MEYPSTFPLLSVNGAPAANMSLDDTITPNANYTVWTFHVKPNLKWSDGTPVTANDMLATFGPTFGFNKTYDFGGLGPEVKSEYAANSSAAVYVLNAPDAHWAEKMSWLYYTPVFPASFVNNQGAAAPNFGTNTVIGPWYVSNYSSGQFQMTMLRNPYYKPNTSVCEVDINFVDSLAATATYLQSGSTDLAPVELSNAQSVLKNPNIHLSILKDSGVLSLEYNVTVYPYNTTAFRQALAYSVNQSQIVAQAFAGFATTAYNAEGVIPTGSPWYYPNIPNYSFNQTHAVQLLNSIGIKKGSDGYMQYPNGTDVALSVWTDTDNPADSIAGGIIANNFKQVGLKINLVTTSEANLIGDYSSNVNGIARIGMVLFSPGVTTFGDAWLSSAPGCLTYFAPTICNVHWEYPPSADAEYQSNQTGMAQTSDATLEHKYLDNIQVLNAQYLPTIIFGYPDVIMAYNTQNWSNWPTKYTIDISNASPNVTALAQLQPASSLNTSTTTQPSPTLTQTTQTTQSSQASVSTSTGAAQAAQSGGLSTTTIVGVAVVVIVILGAVGYFATRKRGQPK